MKFWNFLKRHSVYFFLILLGLVFLDFQRQFVELILSLLIVGASTVFLASVALYAYTKFNFQEALSEEEKSAKIIATGLIYVGTAIVVAGCVFGMYYIYFVN